MKRRDFLAAGLAASAGAVLSSNTDNAAASGEADDLNVALIGVGLQGRALINAALLMKGIRFRAVCDIWEYGQRYGQYYLKNYGHEVKTYSDYREMLTSEEGLDAVIVASPDFVHAEQTNACLGAGLHVYCETMMSNTIEGARSMVRKMRETGKLLQIGYQRRSNPRYLHVHDKLIQEAHLTGRTTHVNAQWVIGISGDRGWPRRQAIPDQVLQQYGYADMHEFRNWRWHRKYSAGLFGNLGGHQVDVTNWFLATPPNSVMASGSGVDAASGQWDKNVLAIFRYETADGPVQASCQMLTETRGDGSGAYEAFLGTDGSVRISQNPRWTAVFRDPNAPDWDQWVRLDYLKTIEQQRLRRSERAAADVAETGLVEKFELPVALDHPVHYPHLKNFFDSIRGEAKLTCPADVAFASEVVAHKTAEAAAAQKTLTFAPDDFSV